MRSCSPLQLLPPLTPHPPPFFSSSFKEVFHPFIRNLINVRHPSHFSTHTHKHTHTPTRPTHKHMHKGKHPHTHTHTVTWGAVLCACSLCPPLQVTWCLIGPRLWVGLRLFHSDRKSTRLNSSH